MRSGFDSTTGLDPATRTWQSGHFQQSAGNCPRTRLTRVSLLLEARAKCGNNGIRQLPRKTADLAAAKAVRSPKLICPTVNLLRVRDRTAVRAAHWCLSIAQLHL